MNDCMTSRSDNIKLMVFINLMFFQIGLLMSIMSALIPEIIRSFKISYGLASMLPFAFYIALTISCIPAGIANEKYSAKKMLLFSSFLALSGALIFVILLSFWSSLVSLFLIGSSVAIIQVTTVPLLRKAFGGENLAIHSSLNQLMYGAGAFLSPVIYSFLSASLLASRENSNFLVGMLRKLVPVHFEWVSAYWLFVILLLCIIPFILWVKFPPHDKGTGNSHSKKIIYLELIRNKYVIFYFISLVAYASCEQGIAAWMSQFFQDFHGLNPQTTGASILSFYWLFLTLGCFAGMLLLRLFEARKVLAGLTILSVFSLTLAIYGNTRISMLAFPMMGAFESIMWPIILSLAINSVSRHHEVLSGFMFTASLEEHWAH